MFVRIGLVVIAMLFATQAAAQENQWGVSFAVTPSWETGPGVNRLFAADRIDMRGSDWRLGFVRGADVDGDWGISLVKTTIADNSSVDFDVQDCSRGPCGTFLRTTGPARLTGFEVHQFEPFKTWRDRFQIGMLGAVGLGWLQGNSVHRRTTTEHGDEEAFDAPASELFPPTQTMIPLLRLELAAAATIVPGLKVRAGGGFSMPGYHTFGMTFVYLIPQR